jgi:hypothetical protein
MEVENSRRKLHAMKDASIKDILSKDNTRVPCKSSKAKLDKRILRKP